MNHSMCQDAETDNIFSFIRHAQLSFHSDHHLRFVHKDTEQGLSEAKKQTNPIPLHLNEPPCFTFTSLRATDSTPQREKVSFSANWYTSGLPGFPLLF